MLQREIKVINKSGLHARPASSFVAEAGSYKSNIYILKNDDRINAKSIMGVMSAGITQGTTIILEADGPDETKALDALTALINSGFGESTI